MKINLTKKSKEQLYTQHNGTGIIFIKTGNNEMRIIKFYLSWSKKFYILNDVIAPTELTERLQDLISEIKEEN